MSPKGLSGAAAACARGQAAKEAQAQRLNRRHLRSDAGGLGSCKLQGVTAQRHVCAEKQKGTDVQHRPCLAVLRFHGQWQPRAIHWVWNEVTQAAGIFTSDCGLGGQHCCLLRLGDNVGSIAVLTRWVAALRGHGRGTPAGQPVQSALRPATRSVRKGACQQQHGNNAMESGQTSLCFLCHVGRRLGRGSFTENPRFAHRARGAAVPKAPLDADVPRD